MSSLMLLLFACGEKTEDTAAAEPVAEPPTEGPSPGEGGPSGSTDVDLSGQLTRYIGCGDMYVFASNEEDSWSLQVSAIGLVQSAFDAASEQSISVDIGTIAETDGPYEVGLNQGQNLTHASCNDAIDPGIEIVVDKEYYPTSGQLELSVVPTGEATSWGELPAEATLSITDAVFCADSESSSDGGAAPDCVFLPSLSFSVSVGWFPG